MNDAIPAARRLALVGYNDALRASDATRLEMNYLVTTASVNTTLEKRITSLFGSFQMATRRSMASENFDSDVLEDFYDSEVDWSIQTNRLRQQYYAANGSAKNAYNVALRSAATTRQTNLLNAAAKYNVDVFNAEEIYAKATAAADSVRTLTSFDSTASYFQSTLRAIGDKLYRNAADDAFFDGEQWDLDEQTLNSIATELAAVRNAACLTDENDETVLKSGSDVGNDFTSISTAFTNIAASISAFDTRTEEYAASSETTSEDSTGGSETTSSVASRRGARTESNQNLYDSAISVANAAYVESVRSSQNDWTLAYLDSLATRNESISTVGSAYQKTQKKAQDSFFFSVAKASTNYSDVTIQNTQTLTYNQEQIDLFGVSVPLSGIFANPTRDYEVCFVAGTPVLMADGTKRPIETIRPGDMVLAANHLEPTSKPAPAKVVRFFDNGEKDVVRLHIGDEEILCTPEHPFYVVGKGWICAQELAFGDMCLNADGESVSFVSRETVEGKLCVYNFEVEREHTYFIGDKNETLVHNACDDVCTQCGGYDKIFVHDIGMIGPLSPPTISVDCNCICHQIDSSLIISSWDGVNLCFQDQTMNEVIGEIENIAKEIDVNWMSWNNTVRKAPLSGTLFVIDNDAKGHCVEWVNYVVDSIVASIKVPSSSTNQKDLTFEPGSDGYSFFLTIPKNNHEYIIAIKPIIFKYQGICPTFFSHAFLRVEFGVKYDGNVRVLGIMYLDNGLYGSKERIVNIHNIPTCDLSPYYTDELCIDRLVKDPLSLYHNSCNLYNSIYFWRRWFQ